MLRSFKRRQFIQGTAAGAVLGAAGLFRGFPAAWGESDTADQLNWKGAMIGKPTAETLESLKEAGFEGIESNDRDATPEDAEATRKRAESLDMRVHSVLFGWANFNSDSAEEDIQHVARTLETAAAYGADAVLLVPCRIGGMAMPEAWEFDIEFDPDTGHVARVAEGDNSEYAEYIKAHNHATDASRKAVEKLIPAAEKTGVVIALENVWNNLWVKPDIFANFVASFDHPMVQAYFDIGNHVKYAPPEEWIRALGKLIAKVHVKDFQLNPDGHGGKFVHPRDGSVDWPSVHAELRKVGYQGWFTIEDGGLSLEEFHRRLDLIFAGK